MRRTDKDNCFIEIPVYASLQADFDAHCQARYKSYIDEYAELCRQSGLNSSSDSYKNAESFAQKKYLVPWDYNQVIGWLRLYVDFRKVVKADYYKAEGKRFSYRSLNKKYTWQTWREIEVWMDEKWTSAQIFKELRSALVKLNKTEQYKHYHIDLRALDSIAPYVDWKQLVFPK